jgi:hypothetical protein
MIDNLGSPVAPRRPLQRLRRWLYFIAAAVGLLGLANAALRPWYLHWGATGAELEGAQPGDDLSPNVRTVATHAITIQAPPLQVWPWIVQTGENRAGFYSYTWLENLVLADMHNADRIVPEWQTRQVGDTVWLARKDRYRGAGRTLVAVYEPAHAMVLVSPRDYEKLLRQGPPITGTWTFILEPQGENASRLIMRTRGTSTGWRERAFDYCIFDPAHFIMERGMLLGIKHRAEQASFPR